MILLRLTTLRKLWLVIRKFKTLSFEDFKNQYSVNEDFFNVIARNTNFDKLKEFIEAHKIIKNTIEIIPIVITEDDLKKIDNVVLEFTHFNHA